MSNERRDAFKLGFLAKLAEAGIEPDLFFIHIQEKKAFLLDTIGSGTADVAKGTFNLGVDAGSLGLQGLIGAPMAAGSALGMSSALLDAPSDDGLAALQKSEELALYKRLTDEVKARLRRRTETVSGHGGTRA